MAFDAGMVAHVVRELDEKITLGKVEKIYQPQRSEIVFMIRCGGENRKLLIDVGSSNARINLSSLSIDNPPTPPMFCMMLRKHFSGARIASVEQLGFERAIRITFDAYDDLGFSSHKHIIVEIMGTYSNLIVTDSDDRIIGAAKQIDFSMSHERQIISGVKYELPPRQQKADPTIITEEDFNDIASKSDLKTPAEKFIIANFSGIAPVVAREIAYRACGNSEGDLYDCRKNLAKEFFKVIATIKDKSGKPHIAYFDKNRPLEYSFIPLEQYGDGSAIEELSSFGELIDRFFFTRAENERLHNRASDVQRILSNAEKRVTKKLAVLRSELASCDEDEKYKLWGDLITANIYWIERGARSVTLENWYDGMSEITIRLDEKLTPAQNAQKYYKKYAKLKSARSHLTEQIALAERDEEYLASVKYSLSVAQTESEIAQIRTELHDSSFANRMRGATDRRRLVPSFTKYRTSGGYLLYVGKNNLANDYITFKLAEKSDWWFHVKGMPGSHVLMKCSPSDEPSELDFTEAATVAAVNSKAAQGAAVEVDYTRARYVKKPPAAKPGYVIYHTNYSTRVASDKETADSLLEK